MEEAALSFFSCRHASHHSSFQDKLEGVLDFSHQQMEQYQELPAHAQKIAYQQRLLQEDLVTIRAQISRLSTVCLCVHQTALSFDLAHTACIVSVV